MGQCLCPVYLGTTGVVLASVGMGGSLELDPRGLGHRAGHGPGKKGSLWILPNSLSDNELELRGFLGGYRIPLREDQSTHTRN